MPGTNDKKLVGYAAFNTDSNTVTFGGAYLQSDSVDTIVKDLRMGNLVSGFKQVIPEQEVVFAQKSGGHVVLGGSGLELKEPEGGFSNDDLQTIDRFVTRMNGLLDRLRDHQRSKASTQDA